MSAKYRRGTMVQADRSSPPSELLNGRHTEMTLPTGDELTINPDLWEKDGAVNGPHFHVHP